MKKLMVILCILLVGCTSRKEASMPTVMEKSIMESMTIQEMHDCIAYDPFMKTVFEKVDEYNKSYSDVEKAEFYAITYKRAYSYLKYIEENQEVIKKLYKQDKYSEAFDMQIKKDTLCNTYFYAKASDTPPPVDDIENVVDTTAAP